MTDLNVAGVICDISFGAIPGDVQTTLVGSGSVKTYLSGAAATAVVIAELRMITDPPAPDPTVAVAINAHYAGFLTEDYLVHNGIPNGRSQCEAIGTSFVSVGAYTFSSVPPAPLAINTKANVRWLPTDGSFSPAGWAPTFGGGLNFLSDPNFTPYLDDSYSFQVRGKEELKLPAVVFSTDAYMTLDSVAWSAQAFTVVVVAVLQNNPEGAMYGIVESIKPVDLNASTIALDDIARTQTTNWGVRFRQGLIELWTGGVVIDHQIVSPQNRAVMIGISMSTVGGSLFVLDQNKSSRSFTTDRVQLYNTQLNLGRTGSGKASETAWMDVLEVDFYDHALSFDDFAELAHNIDSVYGIVG